MIASENLVASLRNNHFYGKALEEVKRKKKMKTVFDELFKYHHKRNFYRKIYEELLPVAWHPDRVYDWCFDEEEKGFLEEMWGS